MLYPTGECIQADHQNSPRFRNYNGGIRYVAVERENLAKYGKNNRDGECWRAATENRN